MKFRFAKRICNWELLTIDVPGENCTVEKFFDSLNLSIEDWDVFINGLPTSPENILKETDNIVLLSKLGI